ncbi:MAG: class I SAM-dependent methyltransferase [Frankiaceae bacterium]|nr:class I SAM-dependent methyltransferase [Frankiaceae bacterium]
MPTIANTDMAAAWDGDEGAHWVEHADVYENSGWRIWQHFLDAVPITSDATVLDIGCGTGKSTRSVARIAMDGSALGVDLSARMLALARRRADGEGLANIRFEQADAQVHPFPPATYDLAISSFGAMFFADPVAGFTNITQALRPGGRLALLAWREPTSNAWITGVRGALALGRDLPWPPPNAPGPFAFAEPEHVRGVLGAAGFVGVELDEINASMEFGANAADAFAFMRTMGITRGLTHDLDPDTRQQALDALEQTLIEHETDDGVLFDSAVWLITATKA